MFFGRSCFRVQPQGTGTSTALQTVRRASLHRGMRIRVGDVLDLLAAGLTMDQIVEEMTDIEVDDIKACLAFARRRIDHPSIAA